MAFCKLGFHSNQNVSGLPASSCHQVAVGEYRTDGQASRGKAAAIGDQANKLAYISNASALKHFDVYETFLDDIGETSMRFLVFLAAFCVAMSATEAVMAQGAIAVDDQAGSKPSAAGYGIGFGDDRESAQAAALQRCEAAGNQGCRVVVWFDTCGAYASSNDHYGIGWGESASIAKEKALAQCGGDACRVIATDCGD